MKVRYKRVDKTLPIPAYQTRGSIAFDLYAREGTKVAPQSITLVPANLIVEVPDGYGLFLSARSSLPLKTGLDVPNAPGVIDRDYNGEKDEIRVQIRNLTYYPVVIERGTRIAQAFLLPVPEMELVEVEQVSAVSRGGFGSTGSGV
jgi:dUTP pyrophosphatase